MAVEQGLDAKRIQELDRAHVLHSWSVQSQISPLPVAGAEGRYFWDHDGNRYLDFASQLVNVNLGHQHPKVVAAIREQAEKLTTIGPPMAHEARSELAPTAALAATPTRARSARARRTSRRSSSTRGRRTSPRCCSRRSSGRTA